MLIAKYSFWTLMYHLSTILKQNPLRFIADLFRLVLNFLVRFSEPVYYHPTMVVNGVDGLVGYWKTNQTIPPPEFVKNGFLKLREEAVKLQQERGT